MYRPAWRISHTGVYGVGSRRQALMKGVSDRAAGCVEFSDMGAAPLQAVERQRSTKRLGGSSRQTDQERHDRFGKGGRFLDIRQVAGPGNDDQLRAGNAAVHQL